MTNEEDCMSCKWCNVNRISWYKKLYYQINPFVRLYIECCNPNVFWTYKSKRRLLPCCNARVDVPDEETIKRCGTNKKYFE